MTSPVDTLKALVAKWRLEYADHPPRDPFRTRTKHMANELDAAIAALSGGEAVAWQYRWTDEAWERAGGWKPCERHEYEARKLDHNYPRPELEFRALYTTPRAVGEGMVVVPREPTEAMREAWFSVNHLLDPETSRHTFHGDAGQWLACYRAMLSAAPSEGSNKVAATCGNTGLEIPVGSQGLNSGLTPSEGSAPINYQSADSRLIVEGSAQGELPECGFCDCNETEPCRRASTGQVPEEVQDACDDILHRLEGWASAYPIDTFPEPTKEQCEWIHANKPGLMDRIAASMGRHMAGCIAEDLAALRRVFATPPASSQGDR